MQRIVVACLVVFSAEFICAEFICAKAFGQESLDQSFQDDVRPYLQQFCLDCHGAEEPEAKLDLSRLTSANDFGDAFQTWATIRKRIEAGEMPPPDAEQQPTLTQNSTVLNWIQQARSVEATRNAGDPGVVLARRLSNAEYNYTIRDLTGVDIRPTTTFPVDSANEAGFDNTGESLTMSPALLNKYLGAARKVVEHLVLLPSADEPLQHDSSPPVDTRQQTDSSSKHSAMDFGGLTFAPHPVVTDTDRDKYCVKRIVDFYKRQPVDYADYFYAAWQVRRMARTDPPDARFEDVAKQHSVSEKYLRTVWNLLHDSTHTFGPILKLQSLWNELPAADSPVDDRLIETVQTQCRAMADFVAELRPKLVPTVEIVSVRELHKGSQTMVLWRNRQRAANRQKFSPERLQVRDDDAEEPADDESEIDEMLLVSADADQRQQQEAAFAEFCRVFPDAFFISERGRDYVKASSKQQGEKGRLLSAGFHSMMGYFRDDGPLYDLILDSDQQRELDQLWQQLDFIASAPMRQYVGFLWFERTDSRYMRDPVFDFARPEDRNAQSASMIQKLAGVYTKKAQDNGGSPEVIDAIRYYFREINEQIRRVEQSRRDSQQSHLRAVVNFAERAFRRPLSPGESEELVTFYHALRDDEGLAHEEAIQDVLVSILMSPHFCYRVNRSPNGESTQPLSDVELASRLSYFLWSSMPDEELLRVAKTGTLHQPKTLIAQTRRMLQDDRVRGLALEFAGNWLDIRRFEEHNSVDRERFPEFNDELRQAMFEEPIRFFTDVIQRDQSLLSFLNADHTFVNATLATHYEAHDVPFNGQDWVRLNDARSYGRGGLLPMSVFLTKNAPGLRTSPVKRGYWVVRRLLGEQIPPPPPDVPELPADESQLGDLTLREALARHRDHASCASCHEKIDSFGLVFEGFGPVGERRDVDLGGRPVDTTAQLPGDHQAVGVDDLRTYLVNNRREEFIENLCRKMVSYGLGRSLILSDDLLIRDIRKQLESGDYRAGILIESIVTSPQFLNQRGKGDHR